MAEPYNSFAGSTLRRMADVDDQPSTSDRLALSTAQRVAAMNELSAGRPVDPAALQQIDTQYKSISTEALDGLRRAGYSMGASVKATFGQLAENVAPEYGRRVVQSAVQDMENMPSSLRPTFQTFDEAQNAGLRGLVQYGSGVLGEGLPSVGANVVGGLIGRGAFRALGRSGLTGQIAGGTLTSLPMESGETALEMAQDPNSMKLSPAERTALMLTRGGANAVLESAVPAMTTERIFGNAARTAAGFRPALANVGKATAQGALGEYGTEFAQDLTGQAALMYANRENKFDWGKANEAGIRGAIVGGVLGGGGGAIQSGVDNLAAARDAAIKKAAEKMPDMPKAPSVDAVMGRFFEILDNPRQFGVDAGNATLGAVEQILKASSQAGDVAAAGMDKTGDVVNAVKERLDGFIINNIAPERRERYLDMTSRLQTLGMEEWQALKAGLESDSGLTLNEALGMAANTASKKIADGASAVANWVGEVVGGFRDAVKKTPPGEKQSFVVKQFSKEEREGLLNDISKLSPQLSELVKGLKVVNINDRRQFADQLLSAFTNRSYFEGPQTPEKQKLLDGWKQLTGTDLPQVFNAIRERQNTIAATKRGADREPGENSWDKMSDVDPVRSPFNLDSFRQSMVQERFKNNPDTGIEVALSSDDLTPSQIAKLIGKRVGRDQFANYRKDEVKDDQPLVIKVNPMSLSMMTKTSDFREAFAGDVDEYDSSKSIDEQAGDRFSAGVSTLVDRGIDIDLPDGRIARIKVSPRFNLGTDDSVGPNFPVVPDSAILNRGKGQAPFTYGDYRGAKPRKDWPAQLRRLDRFKGNLDEAIPTLRKETDDPSAQQLLKVAYARAKQNNGGNQAAVSDADLNAALQVYHGELRNRQASRKLDNDLRYEREAVREALMNEDMTRADVEMLLTYYRNELIDLETGEPVSDADKESVLPYFFKSLYDIDLIDLAANDPRRAKQADLIEEILESIEKSEEQSDAIMTGRGEIVDRDAEEFLTSKLTDLENANTSALLRAVNDAERTGKPVTENSASTPPELQNKVLKAIAGAETQARLEQIGARLKAVADQLTPGGLDRVRKAYSEKLQELSTTELVKTILKTIDEAKTVLRLQQIGARIKEVADQIAPAAMSRLREAYANRLSELKPTAAQDDGAKPAVKPGWRALYEGKDGRPEAGNFVYGSKKEAEENSEIGAVFVGNPAATQKFTYARSDKDGYEVSTAGDKRFSALNAKLKDGRTIEEAYQLDVKGYRSEGNDWHLGKGKPPKQPMTSAQLYDKYLALWQQWAKENPSLIEELREKAAGKTLTDKFAGTAINQARALADILNSAPAKKAPAERLSSVTDVKGAKITRPEVKESRDNPKKTPEQRSADAKRRNKTVRPDDDLLTALGKMGGIQFSELERDGADPASLKAENRRRIAKPFRRGGGMSLDAAAEVMAEMGYDVYDEAGRVDASKARELIDEALMGEDVYTPEGYELRRGRDEEDKAKSEAKDKRKAERKAKKEAKEEAEKATAAKAAKEKFLKFVEKVAGKRIKVLFDQDLAEGVAATYRDLPTLDQVRNERRELLADKKKTDVGERTSKMNDDAITERLAELMDMEKALLEDKAVRGLIRVAIGREGQAGLAEHETIHGAFSFFFTAQEKSALGLAFSQGLVGKRLREYFKDQPQILNVIDPKSESFDAEEAAAYGFQVWSMDPTALKLGEKATSLFERFKAFFRKILGILTPEEKAALIFEDLKQGNRAPEGAASPLAKKLDKDQPWGERAQQFTRDISNMLEKGYDYFLTGMNDRILKLENPQLTRIAKLAYEATGDEGQGGMIQKMRHRTRLWENRADKLFQGLSDEDLLALHEAKIFNKPPTNSRLLEKYKEFNQLFDDLYQYQNRAGVVMNKVGIDGSYYPLTWDPEKVLKNKDAFLAMLGKYEDKLAGSQKTPTEIWESITSYIERGEDLVNVMGKNGEPISEHSRTRTLGFISREDRRPFMTDDAKQNTVRYIKQAVRQAEYVRAFGMNGSRLAEMKNEARSVYGATADDTALVDDMIDGLLGNKEIGMSRELKDLYGGMTVYQNIRLLPFAIFNSLIDPLGIAVRSNSIGDAWGTFTYSMRNLFKGWKAEYTRDQWEMIAEDWGIIERAGTTLSTHNLYDGVTLRGTTKKINDAFFKYNLLNGWIRNNTIMAVSAAQRFMYRAAEGKFGEAASQRYLDELALSKDDIVYDAGKGRILMRKEELMAAGKSEKQAAAIEGRLRIATDKFVRQALINPSAAELPGWASNPYLAPIAHLKTFVWGFNATITNRIYNELSYGNYKPAMLAAAYVPGMIAATFMKDMVNGFGEEPPYKKEWGVTDYVMEGIAKSGLTGTGQFFMSAKEDIARGGLGIEYALGPTFGQGRGLLQALQSDKDGAMWNWMVKSMPANPVYDNFLLAN